MAGVFDADQAKRGLGLQSPNLLQSPKPRTPRVRKKHVGPPRRHGPKKQLKVESVICILHTAYAQFDATYIAPPGGLKSPPEKRVCLALLVHAGIIALRYPALY